MFFEKAIPSILERYELKYMIPFNLIKPITEFVSTYCSLDKYSEISDDQFYEVNSLYFDSPEFTFLHNRIIGVENRFNMRIRSYGTGDIPPYFFEIKQKTGDISKKFRAQIDSEISILDDNNNYKKLNILSDNFNNMELFLRLHETYNTSPKILTSYRRKAYISDFDTYARVTFDKELSYIKKEKLTVNPPHNKMTYYDNTDIFPEGCSVVLELKCLKNYVPQWMLDLITTFDLKRTGFSKYANSLKDLFENEI